MKSFWSVTLLGTGLIAFQGCKAEPEKAETVPAVVNSPVVERTEIQRIDVSPPTENNPTATNAIVSANPATTVSQVSSGDQESSESAFIRNGEIELYRQQISSTLNQVKTSDFPSDKAKAAAEGMAWDLQVELELAKKSGSAKEADEHRKTIEQGIQRLSALTTEAFEPK